MLANTSERCGPTTCGTRSPRSWVAEGRSVVEVAEQLGHAPTMTLDVYGHVLAELAGQEPRPAEQLIAEARINLRATFAQAVQA